VVQVETLRADISSVVSGIAIRYAISGYAETAADKLDESAVPSWNLSTGSPTRDKNCKES